MRKRHIALRSPSRRPGFALTAFVLSVTLTSLAAIQAGAEEQRNTEQQAWLLAQTACGNGICEAGEDVPLCPPCLEDMPPEFCLCVPTCELDCTLEEDAPIVIPPDPCANLFCPYGCMNGQCLPNPASEDLCKGKFCTYGCVNGLCLPPPAIPCDPYICADGSQRPRCAGDGKPINYFGDPCTTGHTFCHSSAECDAGKTCTVELGDCLSDPSCPGCDVCVGTCILTEQVQVQQSSSSQTPEESAITAHRSQKLLPEPAKNWFPDTDPQSETGKAANLLRDAKVISGYPDGAFRESNPVIRAEAAKFLLTARYGEFPQTGNSGKFWDVQDNEWYVRYVIGAANLSIINGYPDGTFRPAATVNTAEFLKMLVKTFDLETGLPYYSTDVPPNAWYARYVGIAELMNLFPKRTAKLGPEILLTRGEVAEAIARVLMLTE